MAAFSNVVDSLKAMSLTLHACFELKSLDYGAIIIEFVNYFPIKFNGEILFELPLFHHPLGQFRRLQGMDRKLDGHASCKLQTNNIKNLFGLCFRMMKCFRQLCCQNDFSLMFQHSLTCNEAFWSGDSSRFSISR